MDFDLSWSIVTSDGLYWGIATSFTFIEPKDSDSYGLCLDVSIFGTRSRDWLICWHTLGHGPFRKLLIWIHYFILRYTHLWESDIEIFGLFHVIIISYWGIATYLDVLTSRLDFLFMIAAFDRPWSYWHLGFSLLGILGWSQIHTYLLFRIQTFHPWYFHAFYHTRAWSLHSFIPHISPWHMNSHLFLD